MIEEHSIVAESAVAEIIEDDLMISKSSFEIDMSGIQRDIEDLTAAIDNALTVYGDMAVNQSEIDALDRAEAQRRERAMSSVIREADTLRRQLNRDYRAPLDMAKVRYDELMGPVIDLHAAFKQRRLDIDAAEKEQKKHSIRMLYEGLSPRLALPADLEGDLGHAPLVPFDRVLELFGSKWLNKTCSLDSIESELTGIVGRLLAGERRLDGSPLSHRTEALAVYWETFDVDAALARDRELSAIEEAQRAGEARRDGNVRARDDSPSDSRQALGSPEIANPGPVGRKPRVMLIDGATDDECREIGRLCKSLGITGTFKGERFYEAVKALGRGEAS